MLSRTFGLRRLAAALVAALAVAAIAHASTIVFFGAATQLGSTPVGIPTLNDFFLASALLMFLLVTVAGFLGALRRWFVALPVAIVAAVVSAALGTALTQIRAGTTATPDELLSSIIGINLIFVVAAIVATVTAGRTVFRRVSAYRASDPRNIALVRLPSSRLAEGELTHLDRTTVDSELADQQWEGYVAALEAGGFSAIEVDAADDYPDSVFIEDTVVILGSTAVITSPGADSRRGETAAVSAAVNDLGLATHRIALPGTLDGGDVLKVGKTIYVGRGGRTNADGIRQFRDIATLLGYAVVTVPVTKVLHLKSAVTGLPDGTIVGRRKNVDSVELFGRFLATPEDTSAVVALPNGSLLMAASAPKTAALYRDLGYQVITVDISEFEKLEGCVTCLSVRIR